MPRANRDCGKSSLLVLAEVDHACGDIIASVVDDLCERGVRNVNLVSSLTKKGRPGYLLFIDLPNDLLDDVIRVLASELGVLGVRVLHAEHRHVSVVEEVARFTLEMRDGPLAIMVPYKSVTAGNHPPTVHVEHDFCVRLQRELRDEHDVHIPLRALKSSLEAALGERDGTTMRVSEELRQEPP